MSNTDLYKNGVAFRNWEPGQPDNWKGKEHCTGLKWTGSWTDENCDNTFKALCSDIRGEDVNSYRTLKQNCLSSTSLFNVFGFYI